VWQKYRFISYFTETYCDECGPQFNNAELDVSTLKNIFDIALLQIIVVETNRYAQQEISKLSIPSHLAPGLGSEKMWQ
jgi:hypothetical protein